MTPKGARAGRAPVARALRVPSRSPLLTLVAIGYQTYAQLLDLPGRLTPGAPAVTTSGRSSTSRLVVAVAVWARRVQHRRRSHRFPAEVHAAYSAIAGTLPSLAGRITDLCRHGARIAVTTPRRPGERIRLVLLLDDGAIEVAGTIAMAATAPASGYIVGVDFDPLDAPGGRRHRRLVLPHPFGPDCGGPSCPSGPPRGQPARARVRPAGAHARRSRWRPPRRPPPTPAGDADAEGRGHRLRELSATLGAGSGRGAAW